MILTCNHESVWWEDLFYASLMTHEPRNTTNTCVYGTLNHLVHAMLSHGPEFVPIFSFFKKTQNIYRLTIDFYYQAVEFCNKTGGLQRLTCFWTRRALVANCRTAFFGGILTMAWLFLLIIAPASCHMKCWYPSAWHLSTVTAQLSRGITDMR